MSKLIDATIILVGTSHPGNIGATARAMAVMGLHKLVLAQPKTTAHHPEAVARATTATAILENCHTYPCLAEALALTQRAYAFTSRRREAKQTLLDSRAAGLMAALDVAASNQVALVFGPEQSGLSNEEMHLCDYVVEIPTAPEKSSLNLAAAVQLACYELHIASFATRPAAKAKSDLATKKEIQAILAHVAKIVQSYCPRQQQGLHNKMLSRLSLLLNRASPEKADARLLRGLLAAIEQIKQAANN